MTEPPTGPLADPMIPAAERAELVAELRGIISRGEYHVPTDAVAAAMLSAFGGPLGHPALDSVDLPADLDLAP